MQTNASEQIYPERSNGNCFILIVLDVLILAFAAANWSNEPRSLNAGFWCGGILLAMTYGIAMAAHLLVVGVAKSEM